LDKGGSLFVKRFFISLVSVFILVTLLIPTAANAAGEQNFAFQLKFTKNGQPVTSSQINLSCTDSREDAGCRTLNGKSFHVVDGIANVTGRYGYENSPTDPNPAEGINIRLVTYDGSVSEDFQVSITPYILRSGNTLIGTFTVSQNFPTTSPGTGPGSSPGASTSPGTSPGTGPGSTPGVTLPPGPGGGTGSGSIPTIIPVRPPNTLGDVNELVSKLYSAGISIAGVVFVIMFLVGGLQYLTTAGNEEQTSKAKKLMVDAIIGLVLVLAAYAIAKFIGVELGIF
jgi:hypothetical protein